MQRLTLPSFDIDQILICLLVSIRRKIVSINFESHTLKQVCYKISYHSVQESPF